jgi:hypothetical protein
LILHEFFLTNVDVGYLPWIYINDTDIIPADGWWNSVPALDNGEMMWGIYAVYHVLDKSANNYRTQNNVEMYQKLSALAGRYKNWWDLMAKVSVVFKLSNIS